MPGVQRQDGSYACGLSESGAKFLTHDGDLGASSQQSQQTTRSINQQERERCAKNRA